MKRPPSCGQHFKIGNSQRLTSFPVRMTSLQGPAFTLFGKNDPSSASFGSILILSKSPCGESIFKNPWIRWAISSRPLTSKASSIRRTLPNALISNGVREPFGFSNKSAGPTLSGCLPFARAIRCVTSVISSTGSTSARIRFNSPSFSNFRTNSRKSAYATHSSQWHRLQPVHTDPTSSSAPVAANCSTNPFASRLCESELRAFSEAFVGTLAAGSLSTVVS